MRDLLPPQLLARRKQGFAIPIQRWFREGLHDHFLETVLAEDARSARYLDPTHARYLLESHATRREDYGHHLWTLLVFEHWLRYAEDLAGITLD